MSVSTNRRRLFGTRRAVASARSLIAKPRSMRRGHTAPDQGFHLVQPRLEAAPVSGSIAFRFGTSTPETPSGAAAPGSRSRRSPTPSPPGSPWPKGSGAGGTTSPGTLRPGHHPALGAAHHPRGRRQPTRALPPHVPTNPCGTSDSPSRWSAPGRDSPSTAAARSPSTSPATASVAFGSKPSASTTPTGSSACA